jgi:hypothetical protein
LFFYEAWMFRRVRFGNLHHDNSEDGWSEKMERKIMSGRDVKILSLESFVWLIAEMNCGELDQFGARKPAGCNSWR